MLPPDVEPVEQTAGLAPDVDGAGVMLALAAAISGCLIGILIGLLIGWGMA